MPNGSAMFPRVCKTSVVNTSSRSVLTASLAAVVALAAYIGTVPLTIVIVVLVLSLSIGWAPLLNLAAPKGSAFVIGVTGLGAVAVLAGETNLASLDLLPLVLAMGVILTFINELLRKDERKDMMVSLSGTISGLVVTVASAGWLATATGDLGIELVTTAAAALATSSTVVALKIVEWLRAGLCIVVGASIGLLVAFVLPQIDAFFGLWSGMIAGLLVITLNLLFQHLDAKLPSKENWLANLALVVLPVALGGIMVYVVSHVLNG